MTSVNTGGHWNYFNNLKGAWTFRCTGGTVLFYDGENAPAADQDVITLSDVPVNINIGTKLWMQAVSGSPHIYISPVTPDSTVPDEPVSPPSHSGQPDTPQQATPKEPDYYFVIPIAGQSNASARGEGLPLPATLDAPHPRIKQLARRPTVTPGGEPCRYNDIIPLDHCPHDVDDMSHLNHPKADLSKGEYGCVGQALHIARKLLPYIPDNAGILMVPCCRGGAAFTQGDEGAFSPDSGATSASRRWGVGKPLYQDLISRTKAALDKNPRNVLLAVCWLQGENDLATMAQAQQQPALFADQVKQFRADLADYAGQCPDFNPDNVPWLCGDTTYYWLQHYPDQYPVVYGAYAKCREPNVWFLPFMKDENGAYTPTNAPAEDPDIPAADYYGSASRTSGNWVWSERPSHFSSWARRNIIPERFASAILLHAGRKTLLAAPAADTTAAATASSTATVPFYSPDISGFGYDARRGTGSLSAQGFTTRNGTITAKPNPDGKGGSVLDIVHQSGKKWTTEQHVSGGIDLVKFGGRVAVKFRLTSALVANQNAFGMYLLVSSADIPAGVSFPGKASGNYAFVIAFFVQTDATSINLMNHGLTPEKVGTFGAYDTNWHTLELLYPGGNSLNVTPVLDGVTGTPFGLQVNTGLTAANTLSVQGVSTSASYSLQMDTFHVDIYRDNGEITLNSNDRSCEVFFPPAYYGGKVIIPDARTDTGNTAHITVNGGATVTLKPASNNVLLNGLPSEQTTDKSVTLIQTGSDGKTWVTE
ncbi:sialate O-acetylesterase [Salmonella enterica subsp. enterica serovar Montevideo]|nr:sialate O-acetylesterase [Salmonella enterica subsp. enterica serovar Montevideo]